MSGRHLTIFTRYPKPGRTKTRLIPALGAEEAALLQTAMTGRTVLTARHAARSQGFRAEIRFTGGSRRQMRRWLGPGLAYTTQGSGDLGLRMSRAFRDHLHERHDAAVIIGSDCPGLTPSIIRQAFNALLDTDLVIGPAADGGYYLIGLKAPARRGRVCLAPASVTVSDRRWSALGTWKTTAINQLVLAGYGLGVPPSLLARLYGRRRDLAKP